MAPARSVLVVIYGPHLTAIGTLKGCPVSVISPAVVTGIGSGLCDSSCVGALILERAQLFVPLKQLPLDGCPAFLYFVLGH